MCLSRSKDEEPVISPIQPAETVTTFVPLEDEVYTQELNLENSKNLNCSSLKYLIYFSF